MAENQNVSVPFIAHEAAMSRVEKHIKRLWIALIIAVIAIAATNIAWIVYISQYDFESYELVTDGGGNANFIGNDGDIYNGKSNGQEENAEEQKLR